VDPDADHGKQLANNLILLGFETKSAAAAQSALALLDQSPPDIVILDEAVEDLTPGQFLDECERRDLDTFILVLVHDTDLNRVMDWMMEGTFACLEKPINWERFLSVIDKGLENKEAYRQVVNLTKELKFSNQALRDEKAALKEKTENLRFLYDLGTRLSATLDCREIFRTVAFSLNRAFGIEPVIILTDFSRDEAQRLYSSRRLDNDTVAQMVKSCGTGERDVEIVDEGNVEEGTKTFPKAFWDVPLIAAGKTCGQLRVGLNTDAPFGQEKRMLLESAAYQAAQALFNAHQHQRALHMAAHDPLTGLLNRRAFQEHLELEFDRHLRYGTDHSLVIIDLDRFKSVNDRFGHDTGDLVLKMVSEVIAGQVRASDVSARLGGEEFVVLLSNTVGRQAFRQAERIREEIKAIPFTFQNVTYNQTVSMGVADTAAFPLDNPDRLMHLADQALLLAKREGRDTTRRAADLDLVDFRKDSAYA
jgi:diguanylate cyclase (GGDEF)-like protein